jgi:hypothetical protein
LLLREQIRAQRAHDAAVKEVNNNPVDVDCLTMGYANSPMELEIFAAGRANLSRIDRKMVRPKQKRVPAASWKVWSAET